MLLFLKLGFKLFVFSEVDSSQLPVAIPRFSPLVACQISLARSTYTQQVHGEMP